MPRHELTDEERSRGGKKGGPARAEAIAKRRAEAEERASEKLDAALDRAITRYVEALDAGVYETVGDGEERMVVSDHDTRIKAADRITDRLLGKPTQHTELTGADGGPVVLENDVDADRAAAIFAALEERGLIARGSRNGDSAADEVHTP